MRRILFLTLSVLLAAGGWTVGIVAAAAFHGQAVGIFGSGVPTSVPPPSTPCDLVGTCVAAYSMQRKVVNAYAGNALQLSISGPSTQNIGFVAGNVDGGAINTFCGSNNANSCRVHIIYDQSGNGNDMTCSKAAVSGPISLCTTYTDDIPLTWVGSWGSSPKLSLTGLNTGTSFFNNAAPTGTPTGNANISVLIVGNDSTVVSSSSHYGIDFGIFHPTNVADTDLTNFGAVVRSNTGGTGEYRYAGLDIETTSVEVIYGASAGANNYTSPSTDTLSNLGDFTMSATYATSGNAVALDVNDGAYLYSNSLPPGSGNGGTSVNFGNGSTAQVRLMAGGDATLTPGIWYEGLIYASALSQANEQSVQANQQTYYGISAYSCGSGTTAVDTIGATNVSAAYGFRVMNRTQRGPIVAIYNTNSTTYKLIGNAAGTCDIDHATIASFCAVGTCYVYELFNQVFPAGHKDLYTTNLLDNSLLFSPGGAPPTSSSAVVTVSCQNSLPCMNFVGSNSARLGIRSANEPVTRPYTVLAVAEKTSGTSYAGIWADDNSGTMYYGAGPSASTINFFADATHFEQIAGLTNSVWYAMAGMVPAGNATITACASSNGSGSGCSSATSQTTADIGGARWTIGRGNATNPFTGNVTEVVHVNSMAITNANAITIATNQCTYWNFTC